MNIDGEEKQNIDEYERRLRKHVKERRKNADDEIRELMPMRNN